MTFLNNVNGTFFLYTYMYDIGEIGWHISTIIVLGHAKYLLSRLVAVRSHPQTFLLRQDCFYRKQTT